MLSNLSALNMGVQNLQNFQQHSDVLEKIKMQVRDMKVGFMNTDFSALHPSFTSTLQNSLGFNPAQNLQNTSSQGNNDSPNGFPFTSSTPAANKDGKIWNLIYTLSGDWWNIFRRLKLIDVKWNIEFVTAKQRLELRRTVQTSSTGECDHLLRIMFDV